MFPGDTIDNALAQLVKAAADPSLTMLTFAIGSKGVDTGNKVATDSDRPLTFNLGRIQPQSCHSPDVRPTSSASCNSLLKLKTLSHYNLPHQTITEKPDEQHHNQKADDANYGTYVLGFVRPGGPRRESESVQPSPFHLIREHVLNRGGRLPDIMNTTLHFVSSFVLQSNLVD
jgi:hypothetical protein